MDQDAAKAPTKPIRRSEQGATCLYPSKRCDNPRGVKRNGELHNFCDFHRKKANFNQRRLEHKRKYQQEAAPSAPSLPPDVLHQNAAPPPSRQQPDATTTMSFQDSPSTLDPGDIWILQELLKAENDTDEQQQP
jgi:hypothetical protein